MELKFNFSHFKIVAIAAAAIHGNEPCVKDVLSTNFKNAKHKTSKQQKRKGTNIWVSWFECDENDDDDDISRDDSVSLFACDCECEYAKCTNCKDKRLANVRIRRGKPKGIETALGPFSNTQHNC